jgi:hypothetical protein
MSERRNCPHCGSHLLGIGWGSSKDRDGERDWCSVICRGCSARGPQCETEEDAWKGWAGVDNLTRVDKEKLKNHICLCKKNLKSDRVKCCANCPFEEAVVDADVSLASLFEIKRQKLTKRGKKGG